MKIVEGSLIQTTTLNKVLNKFKESKKGQKDVWTARKGDLNI